ncbi:YggS family pyridoxal phosphate-dependent enzyme [Poriferisphaera sp. WC338]|uniref:YggS family pyridoxal phosphate-dependent enzyme n=1 Tax=Poriferisphaera sp. WC338 TaxID=3425129 RepID=UPI003D81B7D7
MTTDNIISPTQLRDAYDQINERIDQAARRSGRKGKDIVMVAVTKNATPDQIRTLVEMGHADLGENRVQQLTQRAPQLNEFLARKKTLSRAAPQSSLGIPDQVRWHMIGHLQRNKVKQVAPLTALIHSVDSLRLAEELHNYAARADRIVDILIQVNSSGEEQKFGVAAPAVLHLAEQIETMMHLRLRGIMTMAPYSDNPEDSRPVFSRTADIFEDLQKEKLGGGNCNVLSMGMSGDFEVAIEEGANVVRIGRALFGSPPPEAE